MKKILFLAGILYSFLGYSQPTALTETDFPVIDDSVTIHKWLMNITESFSDNDPANDSLTVERALQKSMEASGDPAAAYILDSGNINMTATVFYYQEGETVGKKWIEVFPYLPGASDFPDANMAYEQLIQSTQVINYYKKDSSGFYNLGSRTQASNPYSIIWNPPRPDVLFPVDVNIPNNITNFFTTETHSTPDGNYQTDSYYDVIVDQWGDLDIISGTYSNPVTTTYQNCIRVRTTTIDTLIVDASGMQMNFFVKSIFLSWYAPGISEPVLLFSFAQIRNDLDPLYWQLDPSLAWHDEGEWYYSVPYVPVNTEENITVKNHIFIYPNPAKDQITIAGNNIDNIIILNLSGQKMIETKCKNHHIAKINVSNLPSGSYIAKIISNGNIVTRKINKL